MSRAWTPPQRYRARVPVRPLLVVRADGGAGVGVGHLGRSLALVQAWTDRGGDAMLASHDPPTFWADQFERERCPVIDPSAAPTASSWWVEDGSTRSPRRISGRRAARTLFVDDHDTRGTGGEGADLVLDQNLGASLERYPRAAAGLAGPRYALLRRDVRDAPAHHAPGCRSSAGGGARWRPIARCSGPGRGGRLCTPSLGARRYGCSTAQRTWRRSCRTQTSLAAAGTVSWELCRAGVPSVLVAVASNEVRLADDPACGAALTARAEVTPVVDALLALSQDPSARARIGAISRPSSTVGVLVAWCAGFARSSSSCTTSV